MSDFTPPPPHTPSPRIETDIQVTKPSSKRPAMPEKGNKESISSMDDPLPQEIPGDMDAGVFAPSLEIEIDPATFPGMLQDKIPGNITGKLPVLLPVPFPGPLADTFPGNITGDMPSDRPGKKPGKRPWGKLHGEGKMKNSTGNRPGGKWRKPKRPGKFAGTNSTLGDRQGHNETGERPERPHGRRPKWHGKFSKTNRTMGEGKGHNTTGGKLEGGPRKRPAKLLGTERWRESNSTMGGMPGFGPVKRPPKGPGKVAGKDPREDYGKGPGKVPHIFKGEGKGQGKDYGKGPGKVPGMVPGEVPEKSPR